MKVIVMRRILQGGNSGDVVGVLASEAAVVRKLEQLHPMVRVDKSKIFYLYDEVEVEK